MPIRKPGKLPALTIKRTGKKPAAKSDQSIWGYLRWAEELPFRVRLAQTSRDVRLG